ncbi:Protein goliath [Gryllus bimaculatus]|nr:Protein goliath [Gryllus bimaculatus]
MVPLLPLLFLLPIQTSARVLVYSFDWQQAAQAEFPDKPALFGGSLPLDGLKGLLTYRNPANHCLSMSPPPPLENPLGNWVVLVPRNDCHFEDMVRSAQKANFSAVIVHNVHSSDLVPMSADHGNDIMIPAVFVSEEAGIRLQTQYTYNHSYYVLINDELPFDFNTHLLLPFAIVVGICFLIMLVFMVVKCIKDQRRARRHRLPSSSLRKIPTARFQKGDPYETCAICLEDYVEGDKLRVLPCSHAYHTKCIDPWLTRNRRVCPVCKRKVFAHDEQRPSDDSDSDSEGGLTTDDTTPLVRHSLQRPPVTQGGTFQPQQVNPFVRASRAASASQSSLSSEESTGWGRVTRPDTATSAADASSEASSHYGSPHEGQLSVNTEPSQAQPADASHMIV